MSKSLEAQVKAVIAEQLQEDIENLQNEASFIEDLGADSLDLIELVMAMEDRFHIEIPDDEAEKIQTVQDAINFVKQHASDLEAE